MFAKIGMIQGVLQSLNENSGFLVGSIVTVSPLNSVTLKMIGIIVRFVYKNICKK